MNINLVKPPQQPESGPGGAEYIYQEVIKNVYETGEDQYWIFEPAYPIPRTAPLIVFNHGWGFINPKIYGAWIEHIVRRGNLVVYPRYQLNLRTPLNRFTHNSIQAVKKAIIQLQSAEHVQPELDKFAIVGHSAGGQITANMAALASSFNLPVPKAIMCVQPGRTRSKNERFIIPCEDLSKIDKNSLLLIVVGDRDNMALTIDAKAIFYETSQIPSVNKNFVVVVSDDYGKPVLNADHFSPCAINEDYDSGDRIPLLKDKSKPKSQSNDNSHEDLMFQVRSYDSNALNYYGFWKLFDGLCDAAFYHKNRDWALGNTPLQRFMGNWSDGTLIKELLVINNP